MVTTCDQVHRMHNAFTRTYVLYLWRSLHPVVLCSRVSIFDAPIFVAPCIHRSDTTKKKKGKASNEPTKVERIELEEKKNCSRYRNDFVKAISV